MSYQTQVAIACLIPCVVVGVATIVFAAYAAYKFRKG